MLCPNSTYCALVPYLTRALISEESFTSMFEPDCDAGSDFTPFLTMFQTYVKTLPLQLWGVSDSAATILLDAKDGSAPLASAQLERQGSSKKVKLKVAAGLGVFTTALRLLDVAAWLWGSAEMQQQVLCHVRRPGWVGKNHFLEKMCDLCQTLQEFRSLGYSLKMLKTTVPSNQSTSSAPLEVRLAEEYVGLGKSRKALTVVKNLLYLGFALSIMLKGNITVSDERVTESSDFPSLKKLFAEVEASKLRQSVLQAVAISPLIGLVALDLTKGTAVCPEETLVNMKRFGNQKPQEILALERAVWTAVFGISRGHHSAIAAFFKLQDDWANEDWETKLCGQTRHFFARDCYTPYDPCESLCDSQVAQPLPPDWPCLPGTNRATSPTASEPDHDPQVEPENNSSPAGDDIASHRPDAGGEMDVDDDAQMEPEKNSSPAGDNIGSDRPNAGGEMGVDDDDVGDVRDAPPNEGDGTDNGVPPRRSERLGAKSKVDAALNRSSSRDGRTSSPPGKPRPAPGKKPCPPHRRKPLAAPICSDDDDDDDDDIPVLAYADLCSQSLEERQRLEEEILIKVEEDEERWGPVQTTKPALEIDNVLSVYSSSKSKSFTFYDGKKQPHILTPFIHDKGDYDAWTAIFEAAKPRFIEDPDSSLICCVDGPTARRMTVQELQGVLCQRSLVITDGTPERLEFNLEGLGKLADIDHQMDIQDGRFQRRVVTGTLRDLYNTSIAPQGKKKSLNALYLPNPHALVEESPYSTDIHAIYRIAGHDKHCPRQMPTPDARWSLAATEGAHHYYHIDSRGDGTFIDVVQGQKIWVVAEPKEKMKETSVKLWTEENLDVTFLDPSQWNVEAVLLTEGTRFLMRPGTVHAVFTPRDAICRGGHFLATSTMSRTLYGAIHCFFRESLLTNIDHPTIQSRVNAIVCYFYKALALGTSDLGFLPNVSTQDGLEQLLATICLVELQNVICSSSYRPTGEELVAWRLSNAGISIDDALSLYDISAATYAMRMENIYSRGRGISLLKAVFGRITIQDRDGKVVDGWSALFIPMLAHLIVALQRYYQMTFEQVGDGEGDNRAEPMEQDDRSDAEEDLREGGEEKEHEDEFDDVAIPPQTLFYRQLQWSSSRWPELQAAVDELTLETTNFLAWEFPPITITAVSPFAPSSPLTNRELMRLGLRDGDQMYLRAYRKYGPSTKAEVKEESTQDQDYDRLKSPNADSAGQKRKARQSDAPSKKARHNSS
ncbi:hypothetical protein EST38_g6372 [Candolleomyces aberdarensis]|uniref:JmjC domain-containing protein n=1 Tax=Candolleomyces aberdarensis TaxID=2316362 RepID=A0A4Q2DL52_9AGAR|nr:hypothetical protein EST38_g6372 [Candolleomyces aberdarensis]